MTIKNLLSRSELACLFNVNIRTIDRWRKNGMPYLKIGYTVKFNQKAINKWLKKQIKE